MTHESPCESDKCPVKISSMNECVNESLQLPSSKYVCNKLYVKKSDKECSRIDNLTKKEKDKEMNILFPKNVAKKDGGKREKYDTTQIDRVMDIINFESDYKKLIMSEIDLDISDPLHPHSIAEPIPHQFTKYGKTPSKILLYDQKRQCKIVRKIKQLTGNYDTSINKVSMQELSELDTIIYEDRCYENIGNNVIFSNEMKQKMEMAIGSKLNDLNNKNDIDKHLIRKIKELEEAKDMIKENTFSSNLVNKIITRLSHEKIFEDSVQFHKSGEKYMEICKSIKSSDDKPFLRHVNRLLINVKINDIYHKMEMDSGSSLSIIDIKVLQRIYPDFQLKCKKIPANLELSSVTGSKLVVIGTYEMQMVIPIIGLQKVNIVVVSGANSSLLGRDFMTQFNVNLSFKKDKQIISFGKVRKEMIIKNDNEIIIQNRLKKVTFDLKGLKVKKGLYEIKLVKGPKDVFMPDSLISVHKKNKKVTLMISTTEQSEKIIQKNELLFEIYKMGKKDIIKPERISDSDLDNAIYIPSYEVETNLLPELSVKHVFSDLAQYVTPEKCENEKFDMKNVCIPCIIECKNKIQEDTLRGEMKGRSLNEYLKQEHEKHVDISLKDYIHKINITTENLNVFEFEDNDDKNPNFEEKVNDFNLAPGELGIPQFKTKKEIEQIVKEKIAHLPEKVQNILLKPLIDNELRGRCAWDIPLTKDELNYNINDPKEEIKKQCKIYPTKPEHQKSLFATLQFLLFYSIIERAPENESYGSPLFTISRKGVPGESSRSLRILVDQRLVNSKLVGSTICTMVSCFEQLRSIVSGTNYLTTIDITNMYYSIKLSKQVIESGAANFTSIYGTFRFLRGISGNGMTPSFANNLVLKYLFMDSKEIPTFLQQLSSFYDDISLSSRTESMEEHAENVAYLIRRIHDIGFSISLSKSNFCLDLRKEDTEVLGLSISKNKIKITEKRKLDVLNTLQIPQDKKQCQSLVGTINFLRNLMNSEDLKDLGIISSKLKANSLKWDQEGTQALNRLKNSFRTKDFEIAVPDGNVVPLIFSDASDMQTAGLLYFISVDDLEISPDLLPDIKLKDRLKSHLENFNIIAAPLIQNCENILDLAINTYYHYIKVTNPSDNYVISEIINAIIKILPQITFLVYSEDKELTKEEQIVILKKFISELEDGICNTEKYKFAEHLILLAIGNLLNRQVVLTFNLKNSKKAKFPIVKLHFETKLSPVFISYNEDSYTLLALQHSFQGLKPYSILDFDKLTGNSLLKLFKKALKENKIEFGGCYSFQLPESYRDQPIYAKELLAVSSSLNYFQNYLNMKRAYIFIDSSVVLYGLKTVKKQSVTKLHRLGITLASCFPLAKMFLVPGAINPADSFSRLKIEEYIDTSEQLEMTQFLTKYVQKSKNEEKEKGIDDVINILSSEIIKGNLEHFLSIDNIKRYTLLNINRLKKDKYKLIDGLLYDNNKKILLPNECMDAFILYIHSDIHHPGISRTKKALRENYVFESLQLMEERVKKLLSSCIICSTSKASFNKSFLYQSSYGAEIQDSLTIDIIETFRGVSPQSNLPITCVLGVICNTSKYVSIYYLTKNTANNVICALLSHFSQYRLPKYITMDNGSSIRNMKVMALFKLFNIICPRSSPYASRTRSIIERMFRQLRLASRMFKQLYPTINELVAFNFIVRVHNHYKLPIDGVNLSPHFLVNFESNNLFQKQDYKSVICNNWSKRVTLVNPESLATENFDAELAYDKALKLIIENSDLHKEKVNKNRRPHPYKINDIVLPKRFGRERKSEGIFENDPSLVVEIAGSLLVLNSLITNIVTTRHAMHVKQISILKNGEVPQEIIKKYNLYSEEILDEMKNRQEQREKRTETREEGIRTRAQTKKDNDRLIQDVEKDQRNDSESDEETEKRVQFDV